MFITNEEALALSSAEPFNWDQQWIDYSEEKLFSFVRCALSGGCINMPQSDTFLVK